MHEVAVIGGGVAGLAAVRALQQADHAPLLILPSRRRPASFGETLGSGAARTMDALQWRDLLDDPTVAIPVEGKYSVWGSPVLARHDPQGSPGGFGWHVDRRRLEATMLSHVETMPLRQMTEGVRMVERLPEGWRLHFATGHITARFVIDASGRAAVVARKFGEKRRLDRLVAAYVTFSVEGAELHHASLVDAASLGWWYSAPMPGGRLFVALFSDADLLPGDLSRETAIWSALMDKAPAATRARIESLGIVPDGPVDGIASAGTVLSTKTSGPGWVAIGDAAAAFDPLASHGLTVGLWSGERAAAAAHGVLQGDSSLLDAYEASMAGGVAQFSSGHAVHYGAERRFLDQPFWKRRITALRQSSSSDRSHDDPGRRNRR